MTKSGFRTKFKNIRNNISKEIVSDKSKIITNKLFESELICNCKSVFVYLSYGREVDTQYIIENLFSLNKTVLIPKCNVNSKTMIPVVYLQNDELADNVYGIKETNSQAEYKDYIDAVIVPGIAFDKCGNRIGHGMGYYDKFLQNKNILKIGLCYSECLSDYEFPKDTTDIAMDYVITDREVVRIKP